MSWTYIAIYVNISQPASNMIMKIFGKYQQHLACLIRFDGVVIIWWRWRCCYCSLLGWLALDFWLKCNWIINLFFIVCWEYFRYFSTYLKDSDALFSWIIYIILCIFFNAVCCWLLVSREEFIELMKMWCFFGGEVNLVIIIGVSRLWWV